MDTDSIYPVEAIEETASSIGINSLSESSISTLANDVEFRIKQTIQEATKFMKHGRRTTITIEDINHALRLKNEEPIYGFNTEYRAEFGKLKYGKNEIFYLNEQAIDLEKFIASPLPDLPEDSYLAADWLSVEGVPIKIKNHLNQYVVNNTDENATNNDKEKDVNNRKIIDKDLEQRPEIVYILTQEQKDRFKEIADVLISGNLECLNTAYNALNRDPRALPLLPYIIKYINLTISKHMGAITILNSLLNALDKIISNPFFTCTPYLDPISMTCMLCLFKKKIGKNEVNGLLHWDIRKQACELIKKIFVKIEYRLPNLKKRLLTTLAKAIMDPKNPLSFVYGGIIGIKALGLLYFDDMITPYISEISVRLSSFTSKKDSDKVTKCVECITEYLAEAAEKKKLKKVDKGGLSDLELKELIKFQPLYDQIVQSPQHYAINAYIHRILNSSKKKMMEREIAIIKHDSEIKTKAEKESKRHRK
ncbi:TAF-domain-containing protein [Neoconidiobolus thromboides FSU 785]|nr:TAF-domain-containing protein [Neoconidiobolus thromboides FSU 785]